MIYRFSFGCEASIFMSLGGLIIISLINLPIRLERAMRIVPLR